MTSENPSKTGPAGERRARPRRSASFPTVAIIDTRHVPCQVVNLSGVGALVTAGVHVRLGQIVTLEIPGLGPANGKVQRITSTHFALVFDPALPDSIER